jgi:hypothetical protein
MTELRKLDCANWCESRGLAKGSSGYLAYKNDPSRTRHVIRLKDDPNYRIFLLTRLLDDEQLGFRGALVWLTCWAIYDEVLFPSLYERVRASYGLSPSSEGRLGLEFSANERTEAITFFGLDLIASWDSYYIPLDGSVILFSSNDGFLDMTFKDRDLEERILQRMEPWMTPR